MRRTRGIGGRVPEPAGRLVDAGIDTVVAQEPNDHLGIEVVVLHQTVHILVLFVRHVGHRGVKLGERRHHAVTEPD